MAQLIVRNLDDRVVAALKRKAKLHNRALEQEVRDVLTRAAKLTPEEKLALLKRVSEMSPPLKTDTTALIREDRDSR